MIRPLAAATIVLALWSPCSVSAQPRHVEVRVVQNGKEVRDGDELEFVLQRGPFDLVFEADSAFAILVNASFKPETFMGALSGIPTMDLPGFAETGMAETLFNADRDVIVADSAPSYWYYDAKKDHRFNKVKKRRGRLICTRTIENLYFRETAISGALANARHEPLYLVFVVLPTGRWPEELHPLTIRWADKP